jgi:hypothetical protein
MERERLRPQPDCGDLDGAVVELVIAADGTIEIDNVRFPGQPAA